MKFPTGSELIGLIAVLLAPFLGSQLSSCAGAGRFFPLHPLVLSALAFLGLVFFAILVFLCVAGARKFLFFALVATFWLILFIVVRSEFSLSEKAARIALYSFLSSKNLNSIESSSGVSQDEIASLNENSEISLVLSVPAAGRYDFLVGKDGPIVISVLIEGYKPKVMLWKKRKL